MRTPEKVMLAKLLERLRQLSALHTDQTICGICGDPFELRDGTVSSGICDSCAQTELYDAAEDANKILNAQENAIYRQRRKGLKPNQA